MTASALAQKLLIKSGHAVLLVNAPKDFALNLPAGAAWRPNGRGPADVIVAFAATQKELAKFGPKAVAAVRPDGLLWLCYPKISSKMKSDITRDSGWDVVKAAGWQGVALVSVDETWSAMRFRPISATSRRT